ncbi:MAG TPA: SAM-dependent chlorinase/fluorinase [Kamptonema sp.]|nr:SAM-dependent chlorinase/fluorinase [Kamptonema sp.]
MSKSKIITLLTDFGLRDIYVGVMKGAIAQVNPQLTIVDLTHQISPQNIAAGRFCLMNAYPYFPPGTVHIAVVDPGVGSSRRSIAVECANCLLVGPDNGLFSGVLSQESAIAVVELTNPEYWRISQPSSTFHGRDIFATVGAHLGSGVPLQQLGEAIDADSLVQLPIPACTLTADGVDGCIQYIDYFGNLITNIPGNLVAGKSWTVAIAPSKISSESDRDFVIPSGTSYSSGESSNLIALVGSHGWVEIAVFRGNAQAFLGIDWGAKVEVKIHGNIIPDAALPSSELEANPPKSGK